MIIGKGILAKAFKSSLLDFEGYTIVAAGVSNSAETRQEAFEREKAMMEEIPASDKVVYFSTVSIFDPLKKNTRYVTHKLEMEELVQQRFDMSLIMRLPIVVGANNNPSQLFGHLRSRIVNGEPISIYSKASRYLFYIDDVPKACHELLTKMVHEEKQQLIVNACFQPKVLLSQLAQRIKQRFSQVEVRVLDEGESYEVDNSNFETWTKGVELLSRQPDQVITKFLDSI